MLCMTGRVLFCRFVLLDQPHARVQVLMDDECSEIKWLSHKEYTEMLRNKVKNEFCHETIVKLHEAVMPAYINALKQVGLGRILQGS